MNIFNNPNVQRLTKIFQTENDSKGKVRLPQSGEKVDAGDSVNFSSEAKFFNAVRQRLSDTAEVREDRVQQLRDAIADGRYHVSSSDIAEAMIREGKLP